MNYKKPVHNKLSWDQIKNFFEGHWVELTDFEWEWEKAHPSKALVRHCSTDRNELMSLIKRDGESENSVVLFIGSAQSAVSSFIQHGASPVVL